MLSEQSEKERYRKFFNDAMDKFNISSPADLKSDEQKKKFFNYLDKHWQGSKVVEEHENLVNEANAFLKARAVAIWEDREEFEFNGKVYPVIKVQEENHDYLLEYGSKPLGAGDIRYEGMHRKLSKESFKWYKSKLGFALKSPVAAAKEYDNKNVRRSMVQPESNEDLKNTFKFIEKFIRTHTYGRAGKFREDDLDRLEEIISEFGMS